MNATRLPALLCVFLCLWGLVGCGGSTSLRMDLPAPVDNLDPQYATSQEAQMLLLNLGEGLLTLTPEGEIVPAAAESWQVSQGGRRYTFVLREDIFWEDGVPVEAEHFAYAFRRMFSPGALSPHAEAFSALEGASRLLKGAGFLHSLGVEAADAKTVVFRLEKPDEGFPLLLTQSFALPCREDTFEESRGRFGLEAKYVLSNGPFLLGRWDDSLLRLEPNEHYRTPPGLEVTLYTGREDTFALFLNGKSDLAPVPSGQLDKVKGKTLLAREEKVWCLVFHQNRLPWGNPLLRQGMALCIEEALYAPALGNHLVPAASLLPAEEGASRTFDPGQGARLFALGLEAMELDRPPNAALYAPPEHLETMAQLGQGWQRDLNLHLRVEPADQDRQSALLQNGDYGLILLPFSPERPGPGALLSPFASGNPYGYQNPRYDALLEEAAQLTGEAAEALCRRAEAILLADAAVIPLFRETAYYALAPGISGVRVYPFGGRIDFSAAVLE